ncbi:MAG: hypothetical protein EXS13_05975 [Planctomycetes bacterium]|nr:hypothetical protein [Planctomycetota bacterium]
MSRLKSRSGHARRGALLLTPLFLLLAGCATSTVALLPPPPVDDSATLSLYLRARIASGLGERERALDLLEQTVKLAPDCAPALIALARARRALGDELGSTAALAQALAVAPLDATANVLCARNELRDHQLEPAMSRLLALEARGGAPLEAYELLHPLLLWAGDAARGAAIFARAVASRPAHAFVHEAHADFLACLGREAEALDGYRRALALDPDRQSAELKAARLLEAQGDRILRQLARPVDPRVELPATTGAARGTG